MEREKDQQLLSLSSSSHKYVPSRTKFVGQPEEKGREEGLARSLPSFFGDGGEPASKRAGAAYKTCQGVRPNVHKNKRPTVPLSQLEMSARRLGMTWQALCSGLARRTVLYCT